MTATANRRLSVSSVAPGFKPVILRTAELPANDRGGGNKTIPLVSDAVGSNQILNGITVIAPNSAIGMHTHNCEESVIVIEGRGMVEIEGVEYEVDRFDTTWLPADIPHRFRNTSTEFPLRIFWTYASIAATRTLIDTGDTRSIASEHKERS